MLGRYVNVTSGPWTDSGEFPVSSVCPEEGGRKPEQSHRAAEKRALMTTPSPATASKTAQLGLFPFESMYFKE